MPAWSADDAANDLDDAFAPVLDDVNSVSAAGWHEPVVQAEVASDTNGTAEQSDDFWAKAWQSDLPRLHRRSRAEHEPVETVSAVAAARPPTVRRDAARGSQSPPRPQRRSRGSQSPPRPRDAVVAVRARRDRRDAVVAVRARRDPSQSWQSDAARRDRPESEPERAVRRPTADQSGTAARHRQQTCSRKLRDLSAPAGGGAIGPGRTRSACPGNVWAGTGIRLGAMTRPLSA